MPTQSPKGKRQRGHDATDRRKCMNCGNRYADHFGALSLADLAGCAGFMRRRKLKKQQGKGSNGRTI